MESYTSVENTLKLISDECNTTKQSYKHPFKGVNFVTNNIARRGKLSNGVWFELSYGKGFGDYWLYGVTLSGHSGCKELQGCFTSYDEVEECLLEASKLK